jgi:hypothetical protein
MQISNSFAVVCREFYNKLFQGGSDDLEREERFPFWWFNSGYFNVRCLVRKRHNFISSYQDDRCDTCGVAEIDL